VVVHNFELPDVTLKERNETDILNHFNYTFNSPCFIITVRNRTITFEQGLMSTCLLPRFSALLIDLRASANTSIRTIFATAPLPFPRRKSNLKLSSNPSEHRHNSDLMAAEQRNPQHTLKRSKMTYRCKELPGSDNKFASNNGQNFDAQQSRRYLFGQLLLNWFINKQSVLTNNLYLIAHSD